MNKKPLICIDLDGVCADFYGYMRKIASEYFEKNISELTEDVSYSMNEWGIFSRQDYEDFHRFAVTQRGLFKNVPMIKGARKYINKLSNENFRICIVTHRLCIKYFHNEAIIQTINWLENNGIPFWDICFLKDKSYIKADVFVEDTPKNIEKLRNTNIYTICFSNSSNKDVSEPRANNWESVYKLIKAKYPNV